MLEKLRLRLAAVDALVVLSVFGLCSGLVAGGVILAFRQLIELSQGQLLADGLESYETLPWTLRLGLPAAGGLLIGVAMQLLSAPARRVGVVHVMERLAYHEGHLPLRNAIVQFFGAAASIVAGHSVGREGPGIHLGAASGSLLGQWLGLPNNSIRTLVACGTAAAIAASFNTPIAGVIFAMEVVMMEYSIASFAPVILAAVSATVLTRFVYGDAPAFPVPPLELASLLEMGYVLVMGLAIGALATAFVGLLRWFSGCCANVPIWLRITLAGTGTGVVALAVPQVMGVGYDTVNSALLGQLGAGVLLAVVIGKLLATTFGLGLGLPGGLIGPSLIIGAAAGGAMGVVAGAVFPGDTASPGFYAMMGMGAMMAATLQAPLAALMALLELTANPNIILPGMLAVIAASLTSRELFGTDSVFIMLLKIRGLDYRNDPISQSLRRIGVAAIMDRSFVASEPQLDRAAAAALLEGKPSWVIVERDREPVALLPAVDLARALAEKPADGAEPEAFDLLKIPALRQELAAVHLQATLQEASTILRDCPAEALYVWRMTAPQVRRIYGVITRQIIDSAPLA